jgi:hypothetical protein
MRGGTKALLVHRISTIQPVHSSCCAEKELSTKSRIGHHCSPEHGYRVFGSLSQSSLQLLIGSAEIMLDSPLAEEINKFLGCVLPRIVLNYNQCWMIRLYVCGFSDLSIRHCQYFVLGLQAILPAMFGTAVNNDQRMVVSFNPYAQMSLVEDLVPWIQDSCLMCS